MVEQRGGSAYSFFVGVCDDINPANRFSGTLATRTGGQWLWFIQHVVEVVLRRGKSQEEGTTCRQSRK